MITQKKLKKLLDYNPETGVFRWLVSKKYNIKIGDIAGSINKISGYRYIGINGKTYRASRLAWLFMKGYWPEHVIDHRDRIQDNNVWDNLRHVSQMCNVKNSKTPSNNTSGVVGVSWYKNRDKWIAFITTSKKQIKLGYYTNLIDAVRARWEAEKKYGWPNCNTTSSAFEFLQKEQQS